MNIEPCCERCGTPYAEAKNIHPSELNPKTWLCQECVTELAQMNPFDPEAKKVVISGRATMTNGEYAEHGAITICDYAGVCNPDEFNLADLLADLGHFADREGLNFRAVLRRALRYWAEER